ncbi:MAG: CbtA family protein [Salaquimonas sp.]|jgi:cobalt transporter subunit CbtA|nr:CbtA family protein [Salaquimonas sp.]
MLIRVLLAAVLAGVAAGVFATAAQSVRVTPLILQAETYENGGGHDHHAGGHDHGTTAGTEVAETDEGGAWAPADGWERTFFTLMANIVVGAGFALVITAVILVTGRTVTLTSGLAWGLAGFIVFVLAPGLGLPPELPGTAAADLTARQTWWLATVLATGAGLGILAFRRQALWIVAALALIAAPHLYGAPQPAEHEALVPANLAVEFAIASIATGFVYWLFLGGLLGFVLDRVMRSEAAHLEAAA